MYKTLNIPHLINISGKMMIKPQKIGFLVYFKMFGVLKKLWRYGYKKFHTSQEVLRYRLIIVNVLTPWVYGIF